MEIHLHIHHDGLSRLESLIEKQSTKIEQQRALIERQGTLIEDTQHLIQEQGDQLMAAINVLKDKINSLTATVDTLSASVAELGGDIQEVLDKLNANTDGIDAAGVADLVAMLDAANTKLTDAATAARTVADLVPEPESTEPTGTPTA